jgi:hypothetical protein
MQNTKTRTHDKYIGTNPITPKQAKIIIDRVVDSSTLDDLIRSLRAMMDAYFLQEYYIDKEEKDMVYNDYVLLHEALIRCKMFIDIHKIGTSTETTSTTNPRRPEIL